jgi:hypothetical protein
VNGIAQTCQASDIPAMTTMIAEVYDALLAAGSPEDKARKAAEAIAAFENRFASMDQQFTKIEGELKLQTWMVGFNLAATIGIIFMLLRH